MIRLAYFSPLQPGEYTGTKFSTNPFHVKDVSLSCGSTNFDTLNKTEDALKTSTYRKLEFTTQKNSVWGEVMGHGPSVDSLLCSNSALFRHDLYLREHGDASSQKLATFKREGHCINITQSDITRMLKDAVRFLGSSLGLTTKDVSASSLIMAGAMALLCFGVDTEIIKLVGRWRSDEMIRYLNVQVDPLNINFTKRMLQPGIYCLHPTMRCPILCPATNPSFLSTQLSHITQPCCIWRMENMCLNLAQLKGS